MAASCDEIIKTTSEDDTRTAASRLARSAKDGDIYLLQGPMGAGKTVFARAFIQALMGAEIDVPSPTFTLVQTYDAPLGIVSHFDLYRLKDEGEIYEIGWEDAISDGITIVEWPERLGNLTPPHAINIKIEPLEGEKRHIYITTPMKTDSG